MVSFYLYRKQIYVKKKVTKQRLYSLLLYKTN